MTSFILFGGRWYSHLLQRQCQLIFLIQTGPPQTGQYRPEVDIDNQIDRPREHLWRL